MRSRILRDLGVFNPFIIFGRKFIAEMIPDFFSKLRSIEQISLITYAKGLKQ